MAMKWSALACLIVVLASAIPVCELKVSKPNLETFFCSVDQDGDGEIERHEATKFLHKLDSTVGELPPEFNYGGKTICSEEMRDHLQNMLTPDRVVDWITHGLQLPQYAEAFQKNAISGLDFLWLIENESWALAEELGASSPLHRSKITNAIVRQIFGFGSPPGPPLRLKCQASTWSGIQLSWEPPATLGYPPLHKYLVQRWNKASSSWVPLVDTKETSFLDTKELHLGKEYFYRIQAWGGHGPSDWVTISNCTAVKVKPQFSAFKSAGDLTKGDLTGSAHGENVGKEVTRQRQGDAGGNGWGWVFSVNGCIFLVGILSRQSFFYRVLLAAFVVVKKCFCKLFLKVFEAQSSDKIWTRTVARALVSVYRCWVYVQSKITVLSRQACKGGATGLVDKKFLSRTDSFRDAIGYSTADCTLDEMLAATLSTRLLESKAETHVPFEGRIGTSLNKRTNSTPTLTEQPETSLVSEARSLSAPAFVDHQQLEGNETARPDASMQRRRTRHRCNFAGCKNRFDRWYYPTDWRMRFSKHYCRECQRVFCVKHTRISPHGATGRCGLESTCVCSTCFSSLSPEAREKLERINKLRVGPATEINNSDTGDPFPPDFGSSDCSSLYLNHENGSSGSMSSRSSCSVDDSVIKIQEELLVR